MRRIKKNMAVAILTLILVFSLGSCGAEISGGTEVSNGANISIELKDDIGNTFENLFNNGSVACDQENIYYTIIDDSVRPLVFRLCKSDLNGMNQSVLLDVNAQSLNVLDGWIYYVNVGDLFNVNDDSFSIYKVNVNGKDNQKISDVIAPFIFVQDDIIYAHGAYERFGNKIYKMDLDGNNVEVLIDQPVSAFYIHEGYIYYTEYVSYEQMESIAYPPLSRIRLDGSDQSALIEDFGGAWFTIYMDNIFYVNGDVLYKVGLSGQNQERVAELGRALSPSTYNVYKNKLYYSTLDESVSYTKVTLHIVDMDTGEMKEKYISFQNKPGTLYDINDYVIGNKIFRKEGGKFFVMDLDGSNIKPFPE